MKKHWVGYSDPNSSSIVSSPKSNFFTSSSTEKPKFKKGNNFFDFVIELILTDKFRPTYQKVIFTNFFFVKSKKPP